jgi:hypothetical protein
VKRRSRGSSPAEVKHYLLEQSTPLLLNIAATGPSVFSRGDAVTVLRDMGASRAVLDQAATIAEHDRDDYVRSRGEILRNFMKSMPAAGAAADVKSGGPREQLPIAALNCDRNYLALRSLRIVSASTVPVGGSLLSLWNFLSASTVLGPLTPSTVPSL